MKKTHPLLIEGKKPERVLEALKHTLRQYVRRERNKALPEGVDFWDFACRFGLSAEVAETVHLSAVISSIDTAAKEHATQVYVEIITTHGKRQPRPLAPSDEVVPEVEEDDLPE